MSRRPFVFALGVAALALAHDARAQAPVVIPAPGLVAFEAVDCGPCRRMKPILKRIEQSGARITRIDVDRTRAAAVALRVTRTPTFLAFDRQGREVGRIVGAASEQELRGLAARIRK